MIANDKSVLVTGGGGFVGSSLCPYLESQGWNVRKTSALARPVSGLSADDWEGWAVGIEGCDAVVHLAARVHVASTRSQDQHGSFQLINSEWTLSLARSAARAGVRRFIFISSVKVNGEGRDRAYREIDLPMPQDAYGASKLNAEQKLMEFAHSSKMQVVILRLPLVYGPRVRANFFRMMQLVDKGIPLPLGAIENRRSLLGLDNLCDAIAVCLEHVEAANRLFLISDQQDVSTPKLLEQIAISLGRKSRLFAAPLELLEFAATVTGTSKLLRKLSDSLTVDTSRIRAELGWVPPYSLAAGLQKTAAWFRADVNR